MNGAKIRLSPEPSGGGGTEGDRIYHNIKNELQGNAGMGGWKLSADELSLVVDPDLILAKNRVIAKTVELFAGLGERMRAAAPTQEGPQAEKVKEQTGGEGTKASGELLSCWRNGLKISKGENYKGFPWVVLDYPRCFGREDVLAVRTLFWWGHYFSVTLHLKGSYKTLVLPGIRDRIALLADAGFHICISQDEWRHELAADHYHPLAGLSREALDSILDRPGFLKFSAKTPLDNGAELGETLLRLHNTVISVLSGNVSV
jgi:hypothetical protein